MTPKQAVEVAKGKHPDCAYADWDNGMTAFMQLTIVVSLWRTEENYLHDDPPKYKENYPRTGWDERKAAEGEEGEI